MVAEVVPLGGGRGGDQADLAVAELVEHDGRIAAGVFDQHGGLAVGWQLGLDVAEHLERLEGVLLALGVNQGHHRMVEVLRADVERFAVGPLVGADGGVELGGHRPGPVLVKQLVVGLDVVGVLALAAHEHDQPAAPADELGDLGGQLLALGRRRQVDVGQHQQVLVLQPPGFGRTVVSSSACSV